MKPILCILAGGRSSRFGSPKMSLRIAGQPILTLLSQRLGPLCGQRWLSVAPGSALPPGAGGFDRIIADPVSFAGPLPAMCKVLSAAPSRCAVIFAAGDMPLVSITHLALMLRWLRTHRRTAGVMSRWTQGEDVGRIEPLPCIWRAGVGTHLIRSAMLRGVRGPNALAHWPHVDTVPIGGSITRSQLLNINAREDLLNLRSAFAQSQQKIMHEPHPEG